MNKLYIALALGAGVIGLSSACRVSIPDGAKAVKPFDRDQYLGQWYEIARLDFKFEKNLNNVTANYSKGEEGLIKVTNRGYNFVKKEWKQSIGKAKFVRDPQEARLKVSFFGAFYAGYNVIAIDKNYKYALVAGNNLDYLWILSREKTIPENIKSSYLEKAKELGYQTQDLVWTKHD
ncbi:MAG: lipocalin [Pedobacter sp.]|nr:MAG: lipocalin [Pedobacter sp.]